MPDLLATQLTDLVAMTIRDLGDPKIVEIATSLQKHTAMRELLKDNRGDVQSGYGLQWDVKVALAGNARNVGLAASDIVNIPDTTVQAQADWRNTTCSYAFLGQEMSMNSGPRRIVDLVKSRRFDAMLDLAEIMESNWWGPPVAITDNTTPWGVNTWIVKNATEGFNGGVPSGYTTIGLNPTTYPNWKNYTAQYTSITKDDVVRKWRRASVFTNFEPPVEPTMPSFNTGDDWRYFTNYGLLGPVEEILDASNDNLGSDVAKYDGTLLFRKTPVEWVPKLEADTTNPIYGINFGWYKTIALKGWWMKQTVVPIYPLMHTMNATFIDCTYQIVCRNRRPNFVIATGTTYPS